MGILSGVLEKIDHAELLERELPLKQNDRQRFKNNHTKSIPGTLG